MADSNGILDSLYAGQIAGTKTQISAVPVDIGSYQFLNTVAAITYVQVFYKLAAAVTVGTTVADFYIALPVSGGATLHFGGKGWRTRGPLTIACTTTATNSTGAAVEVMLWKAR